jgi:hypothetical protein
MRLVRRITVVLKYVLRYPYDLLRSVLTRNVLYSLVLSTIRRIAVVVEYVLRYPNPQPLLSPPHAELIGRCFRKTARSREITQAVLLPVLEPSKHMLT